MCRETIPIPNTATLMHTSGIDDLSPLSRYELMSLCAAAEACMRALIGSEVRMHLIVHLVLTVEPRAVSVFVVATEVLEAEVHGALANE